MITTAVLTVLLLQAPVVESDRQILQRLVDRGGLVQLEPRTYVLDGPVTLPSRPVQIQGVREATALVWTHGDGLVGQAQGYYRTMPWVVRDLSIGCAGQCGTAIDFAWPDAGSVNEPTAIIEHITIRPDPTAGAGRSWMHGIRLTNGWGASIREVAIHSDNHNPDSLHTAIFLGRWSTGARISEAILYGGQYGIVLDATEIGHSEGTLISRSEMVNVRIGVHARGRLPGGRPAPWITVTDTHIAARDIGILFEGRAQGSIANNLIYGVPHGAPSFVGIYLAAQSHHTRVIGNQVYVLTPEVHAYGLLADASSGGTVVGNVLTFLPSAAHIHTVGMWFTSSASGWQVHANAISGARWAQLGGGQ